MLVPLASCGADPAVEDTTAADTTAAVTPETTVPESVETQPAEDADFLELKKQLPEANFDGAEYLMLEDTNSQWWILSLYSESMSGEIINDTVFERNKFVEELYNVSIAYKESNQVGDDIKAAVMSGTDAYDVVWERLSSLTVPAQSGHLLNLFEFKGFDFEAEWWDTDSVDALTLNDKLFFACNDINTHAMESCSAIFFSKTLVENNNLDNPYTLVREKKWTLDKMDEMITAVIGDTNGNGTRDEGDTFGMVTGVGQYLSLINGAGERLILRERTDNGDTFTLNIGTESFIDLTMKVCKIMNDKNRTVLVGDDPWGNSAFTKDQSLFYVMQLGSVSGPRANMETDFGILPFPMRDESQGYYTTSVEHTVQAMSVPAIAKELEMIEKVTEAMARYSDLRLIDAYYDTTLKGKIARDKDTSEMLDILTGNRTFDFSRIYDAVWHVYSEFYPFIQVNGGKKLSSFAASMNRRFEKLVADTLAEYNRIEG